VTFLSYHSADDDIIRFDLEGKNLFTFGRNATNDVCINTPSCSRIHATLMIDENGQVMPRHDLFLAHQSSKKPLAQSSWVHISHLASFISLDGSSSKKGQRPSNPPHCVFENLLPHNITELPGTSMLPWMLTPIPKIASHPAVVDGELE